MSQSRRDVAMSRRPARWSPAPSRVARRPSPVPCYTPPSIFDTLATKQMSQKHNAQLLKLLGIGFWYSSYHGREPLVPVTLRVSGTIALQVGDPMIYACGWWLAYMLFRGIMCHRTGCLYAPGRKLVCVCKRRAFGNYFGFLTGFTSWWYCCGTRFGVYTFSESYSPPFFRREDLNQWIAIGIIIFYFLAPHRTHVGGKAQQMLTFTNCWVVFLLFYVFLLGHRVDATAFANIRLKNCSSRSIGRTLSPHSRPFLYLWWLAHRQLFHQENKDPAETMPKSVIIGVLSIIAIYLLVNGAILYVVPVSQLAGTKLAAATRHGSLCLGLRWRSTLPFFTDLCFGYSQLSVDVCN